MQQSAFLKSLQSGTWYGRHVVCFYWLYWLIFALFYTLMPASIPCPTLRWPDGKGCVLAGFLRAADAEMAGLALADRGQDMAGVHCCSDREWPLHMGDGSVQPPLRRDWHWLMIPVDADEVAIVREYLQACGAVNVNYRKNCSKGELREARAELARVMERSKRDVVDEPELAGVTIAEFHPLSWQAWTRGLAGANQTRIRPRSPAASARFDSCAD